MQQSGPRDGPWYQDTPRGINQISKAVSNAAISVCPQFVACHLSDQARPDGTYNWGLYSGRCTATTNLFASGKTPSEVAVKTGHRRLESTHAYNRCSSPSCTPAPCAGSWARASASLTGRPAVHTDTLIRVRLMLMDAPAQISTSTSPTLILIWHFPLRLDIDGHIDSHDFAMSLTCRLSPD